MSAQPTRPGRLIGGIEPKIALPRGSAEILRRSRLLEMLDGNGGAAITVVNSASLVRAGQVRAV
jgi:hypothetical protein